ncbi:MAG: hypothetical protein IBX68_10155 [Dehalococcoidia bacterium]|nr:hypothetical protein [Dehalococcoidia bacterium]
MRMPLLTRLGHLPEILCGTCNDTLVAGVCGCGAGCFDGGFQINASRLLVRFRAGNAHERDFADTRP